MKNTTNAPVIEKLMFWKTPLPWTRVTVLGRPHATTLDVRIEGVNVELSPERLQDLVNRFYEWLTESKPASSVPQETPSPR